MTAFYPLEAVGKGAELRRSPRKVLFHARKRSRIADVWPLSGPQSGGLTRLSILHSWSPSSRTLRCSAEVVP